ASSVALADVYGSGTASIALDDLAHADLALVAGANPASNHPRLVTHLVALRRRGGKVIVINPLREIGLVRFRVPSDWRSMLFCWAMCLTHHAHGVDNVLALANLALARGWLGSPGAGLLPIRGHSNVQCVGSCGMTPGLKQAFAARMVELYGITIPERPGQDTY